ncbi:methyl-accepting chemotaxis protein [Clostridium sp. YIM B02515]|uniref:Methyl-accepting chemotaxis protein n=1 Tax=Clostridium rhizosphaerae TaxID=2803861 RepID=A0ABS1TFR2_9CLOT|nr:methyl-accepting chemotaxis protein [Clostridium rhizosphaerae]MBL4938219.1 methyl-accepting chemotaxis protein [Clostridium rhizosphaerae]
MIVGGIFKSIGMRFKTALIVSLIVIVSLGAVSITGFVFSQKTVVKTNDDLIKSIVESRGKEVQSFLNDAVTKVQGIALLEGLENADPEQGVKALSRVFSHYKDTFDNISFANAEGVRWNYKGEKDTIADRKYFAEAMSTKKPQVSDVLISNTTGKLSVVVAAPILDDQNNAKGIAYATLSLAKLQEMTGKLKYGESGFGFTFDDKGKILSNGKNAEVVGKLELGKEDTKDELKSVWEKRKEAKDTIITYSLSDGESEALIVPIKMNGIDIWYFALSVNKKEVLKELSKLSLTFITVSCVFIGLAVLISIIYSSKITSPIVKLSESVALMANSLREMVKAIINKVEQLAASSQELTATTEEFYGSAQYVSVAVEKVQGNNLDQNAAIEQSNSEAQEGLAMINNLSTSTRQIVETVEDTAKVAGEGQLAMQEAVNQMNLILNSSKELHEFIGKLNDKSNEIGTITGSITGIARQTNLLALNATIEAVRAGESWKGFSVVADEIRKLAEQYQSSASVIKELVEETQKEAQTAVDGMKHFMEIINEGALVVGNAGGTFKQISLETKQAAEKISEMSVLLDNVSKGSVKISEALARIEQASDATTNEIESISTSINQQSGATERIASSAESLSKLAEDLNKIVAKLKLTLKDKVKNGRLFDEQGSIVH